MAFTYRVRSADQWDKRANQTSGEFEGIIHSDHKVFVVKKGQNLVRILPPTWEDADHYGLTVYIHYQVGPNRANVLCLNQMKNMKCPICEARARAQKLGDEDQARDLRPVKRILVWMLDRNDKDRGPMVWQMPFTLDRDFCILAKDPQTGEISPIDHPYDGFDISFEKSGDGIQVQYSGKRLARRPSSVDDEVLDYIAERPLTQVLIWRDYKTVKELYEGGPTEDDPPVAQKAAQETRRRFTNNGDEKPNGSERDKINDEVPFDGGWTVSDEGGNKAASTAERLKQRYQK